MPKITGALQALEKGIESLERRPVDRYLLGPFLIWYGLQSKGMSRWPRRLIISAGIFQFLYAWRDYRELVAKGKEKVNVGT